MEKEDFASVLTMAIFRSNDLLEEEGLAFENEKTLQEGLPQYVSKDKKCLVVYNPILSALQNLKLGFNSFQFVKLNMDDFSYDTILLERNTEWDDAEKIRRTIPYPPKFVAVNSVHVTTQATNCNELYQKLFEECTIPVLEHAEKIKNEMIQRAETVHHEEPRMLLQQSFDEKISGNARFMARKKLYGNAVVIE